MENRSSNKGGALIKYWRGKLGISPEDLTSYVNEYLGRKGLDESKLWRIENGKTKKLPSDEIITAIANGLNRQPEEFLQAFDQDRKLRAITKPVSSFDDALQQHENLAHQYRIIGKNWEAWQQFDKLIAVLQQEIDNPEYRPKELHPDVYEKKLYVRLVWAWVGKVTVDNEFFDHSEILSAAAAKETSEGLRTVGDIIEQKWGERLGISLHHLNRAEKFKIAGKPEETAEELKQVTFDPDGNAIIKTVYWRDTAIISAKLKPPHEVEDMVATVDKLVTESQWEDKDLEWLCQLHEGLALTLARINPPMAFHYLQRSTDYLHQTYSRIRVVQNARTQLLLEPYLETKLKKLLTPVRKDILKLAQPYPRYIQPLQAAK